MIKIKRNDYDEYEVPVGLNSQGEVEIYFTDDKYDAFDTARKVHGILADIVFARGTYTPEDD